MSDTPKKTQEKFNLQMFNNPPKQQGNVKSLIAPNRSQEIGNHYGTIKQGMSTNALTKLRSIEGQTATIDLITGEATIKSKTLTLKVANYSQLAGLRTSTYQLLDAMTIALTETGAKAPTVLLSLSDFMQARGLKDRKSAREQMIGDLQTIRSMLLTWEEKQGKKKLTLKEVMLADAWEWADTRKTVIAFTFGNTFFNILKGYPVMPYPMQLQTFNHKKNPNSYYLLRKATEHKNMNIGKANENTISVETLLASAPYIPTYDQVLHGNKNVTDRIIEPFERDLNACSSTFDWYYCHRQGQPLTDEELKKFNYETFRKLLVTFVWKDYPQTKRKKAISIPASIVDASKKKSNKDT